MQRTLRQSRIAMLLIGLAMPAFAGDRIDFSDLYSNPLQRIEEKQRWLEEKAKRLEEESLYRQLDTERRLNEIEERRRRPSTTWELGR
jgi:hypothetical protein